MAKVIGNTIATPMAVPDMAQTDERKADFVKNKKTSLLENDSGYVTQKDMDEKIGDTEKALDEIIALQEKYIKDNAKDITFNVFGNEYTTKEYTTWEEKLKDTVFADSIGCYGAKNDTGIVWVCGDIFKLGLDGVPVLLTDTIVANARYDCIQNE